MQKLLPIRLPKPKRSAIQFLLRAAPQIIEIFDIPKTILGFNTLSVISKQVYAMSEESAEKKLAALKELLKEW